MSNYTNIGNDVENMKDISGILITVTGQLWRPGIGKIKKELNDEQYRDFLFYCADLMCDSLKEVINKQRYIAKWSPLSSKYLNYKKRKGLSLNIWEATGLMKKEIKVFKKGDTIAVGFRQVDKYSDGSQINMIARYLEYGSTKKKNLSARPMFRPIYEYIRKNIGRYYKKFKKENNIK